MSGERIDHLIEHLRRKVSPEDLALFKAAYKEPEAKDYERAIGRAVSRLRNEEKLFELARSRRKKRYRALVDLPEGRRLTVLRNSSPALLLVLFRDLIVRSWEARFTDPPRSLQLAELAVDIAGVVAKSRYFTENDSSDLLAEAYAYLGNAKRINFDCHAAEGCFKTAEGFLAAGTGDRAVRADYSRLLAFLRVSQGRCEEAATLFDGEIALRRLLGDEESLGFSLVQRGWVATLLEEPKAEIRRFFRQGMARVSDLSLAVQTTHSLAEMFARQGDALGALDALGAGTVPRYFANKRHHEIEHLWIRGIACRALGEFHEAEQTLRAVTADLADLGATDKLALALLDLACVHVALGSTSEASQLACTSFAIYKAEGLEERALGVLAVLQEALEAEKVTEGLAVAVANYLARFPYNKALRFEWKGD